jgi:predicted regulator of Ras-like GTPase activity (Roadblock/LC7/MglB family)
MRKRTIGAIIGAGVLATGLASGVALASSGGGDGDHTVTGPDADRAVAAALAETGGTANAVERDSEQGATWEVEVAKPDGSTVNVRLDSNFHVVVVDPDSETGQH